MTASPDYHRLSIAPMMAYTDRHYRFLMRLFTRRCLLYTEMVVGSTITHNMNGLERFLGFDEVEHPLAVQLGGDDPEVLSRSARVCEDFGYDEINLNVGCPSDRVQRGRFGACLMKEPERVREVVAAMRDVVSIPVTVKHRIGVDDMDSYDHLAAFVAEVEKSGADVFICHARKAWLQGLSPAENRSVPPLDYDAVYRLKREFPHLQIIINGGINSMDEIVAHLEHVDGVMVGRSAYSQPEMFARADELVFGEPFREPPDAMTVLAEMDAYAHRQLEQGHGLSFVLKHLVGLFKNQPGARRWRREITNLIQKRRTDFDLAGLYHQVFQ